MYFFGFLVAAKFFFVLICRLFAFVYSVHDRGHCFISSAAHAEKANEWNLVVFGCMTIVS